MPRRIAVLTVVLAACAPVSCGGDGSASTASATTAGGSATSALARTPAKPGEFVFSGEASPATHGPLTLDGRYLVRFEQFAPENPNRDFSSQTPFTASLQRRAGDTSGEQKLFEAAARTGRRELRLSGRYVLDVSFGDFPYAVRFTPRR